MNPIAKAVDKFSPLTAEDAKALKASGVAAVGRYLGTGPKGMYPSEVAVIKDAGLSVISIYETNPTYRGYFTHAQGASDAKNAVLQAQILGQPSGTPIYFAVDYDCQDADMQTIRDYFDGVRSAIGPYKVGLYGGLRAVSNVAADFYWQTCAWSPSVSPRAAIYQSQVDVAFSGLHVDIDDIYKPCGMWPAQKENVSVNYPKVKVQINGETFPDGIAVNNTTYVLYTALTKVGTPYTHPGYGIIEVGNQQYKGVVVDDDTYIPWSILKKGVKAVHINGGWNFITEQSVQMSHKVLDTWKMEVINDGFFFDLPVSIPSQPDVKTIGHMQLDTGAFEILMDKGIADSLGLPNQGAANIYGVGGQVPAYSSTLPVVVGDNTIDMPCVVDPAWNIMQMGGQGLFGMKGLIDSHIGLIVDPDACTITLIDTSGEQTN